MGKETGQALLDHVPTLEEVELPVLSMDIDVYVISILAKSPPSAHYDRHRKRELDLLTFCLQSGRILRLQYRIAELTDDIPREGGKCPVWVECLEMSLESGLCKLKHFKKMQELNVAEMNTNIGMPEVKWMIKYWPNLKAVYGLHGGKNFDEEATKAWLRKHYPYIFVLKVEELTRALAAMKNNI
ncbi:hypothetical protein EDD11_003270 [Mortierella claussenii]|nr:hypothetical protein EDD11_003270 [Mortierella claussenii]